MGGATSKFAETGWEQAEGCLEDAADTIDQREPTAAYQSYELTKRSFNQREFDITDSNKDLLYSTRSVPGTIACFDVLGRDLDECIMRINVDISRRNWIVYSVDKHIFDGQKHDQDATDKFRADSAEHRVHEGEPSRLYRAAYITVSWSRYSCVASHYGAPTPQMIRQYESLLSSDKVDTSTSNLVSYEQDYAPLLKDDECVGGEGSSPLLVTNHSDHQLDSGDGKDYSDSSDLEETDSRTAPFNQQDCDETTGELQSSVSMPELAEIEHNDGKLIMSHSLSVPSFEPRLDHDEWLKTVAIESTRHVAQWVKSTSQSLHEVRKAFLDNNGKPLHKNHDPREGVVSLDKPLLLCQEIYTHLVGNHQSSRISKDRALDLLRQDEEMHIRNHQSESDGPSMDNELMLAQEMAQPENATTADASSETSLDESGHDKRTDQRISSCSSEQQSPTSIEQPLVGYWLWENTLRTHKMKLHLAKGSDLALHVVLAIIANQVRYERNAIAMTI